jgi:regulator of cell morphogenesis and NO signaling
MQHVDETSSVPDWLIEYPALLAYFEQLGIDYSCGGKSLDVACRKRGLDAVEVIRACEVLLLASGASPKTAPRD